MPWPPTCWVELDINPFFNKEYVLLLSSSKADLAEVKNRPDELINESANLF